VSRTVPMTRYEVPWGINSLPRCGWFEASSTRLSPIGFVPGQRSAAAEWLRIAPGSRHLPFGSAMDARVGPVFFPVNVGRQHAFAQIIQHHQPRGARRLNNCRAVVRGLN
jgi:hypothetical protein